MLLNIEAELSNHLMKPTRFAGNLSPRRSANFGTVGTRWCSIFELVAFSRETRSLPMIRSAWERPLALGCFLAAVGGLFPLTGSSVTMQPSSRAPEVVTAVAPRYPELAKRARVRGEVSLGVVVSARGDVEGISDQIGHALLMEAAVEAVKRWQFDPSPESATRQARLTFSFSFAEMDIGPEEGELRSNFVPPYHMDIKWTWPHTIALKAGSVTPSNCELHGELLLLDSVPIAYASSSDKGYDRAMKKSFPHSMKFVLAGDVLEVPKMQQVLYCPKCRQAELNWLTEHRKGLSPYYRGPSKL